MNWATNSAATGGPTADRAVAEAAMPVATQSATANSMIAATAATAAAIRVMPARVNDPGHQSEGPPHRVTEQRDGRDGPERWCDLDDGDQCRVDPEHGLADLTRGGGQECDTREGGSREPDPGRLDERVRSPRPSA